ncbi:MAG TPA: DinB family protein [Tepidisphaeraceae bacterium]|nr:DinB family protein [Tepidisphaeraceae bacterium]
MKAIDLIRNALVMTDMATMMLVDDLRDAPLTSPTVKGGNHPLWVLGHLTYVEGNIPRIIFGEPNPVDKWKHLFAAGTEPQPNGSAYPSYDEILRTYKELRARNLKTLDELGEAGLDRPTKSPPRGLEQALQTAGQTFLVIAMHQMNHRGQLADARRTLGRAPMFTPGG